MFSPPLNTMLKSLIIVILAAAGAQAGVISQGRDVVFLSDGGKELKRLCPADLPQNEFSRAGKNVTADGTVWNLTARIPSRNKWLIPYAKNALIIAEDFDDYLAADVPLKPGVKRIGPQTPTTGFKVTFFNEAGEVSWEKTLIGKGSVEEARIADDGKLLTLLLKPANNSERGAAQPYRIIIFDGKGKELLFFPPRAGVCKFMTLGAMWTSRTGRYVILTCDEPKHPRTPYFIQPRSGLYWHPKKLYRISSIKEEALESGGKESFVRVVLEEIVRRDPDAEAGPGELSIDGELTDFSLSEVKWSSIKRLK